MSEKIINLLYCLDSNYDIQALVSLNSFLKNYDQSVNIHFIHENSETLKVHESHILKNKNINEIHFYDFSPSDQQIVKLFPINEEMKHITMATYFRLFLNNYLKNDIKNLLYLDPDVVVIKNITTALNEKFDELDLSKFTIGATNYIISDNKENQDFLKQLHMTSHSYFNAGVLLIDYEKWRNHNLSQKLLDSVGEVAEIIKFNDQDILNSHFDGQFLEIGFDYNYPIKENLFFKNKINIEKSVYLVHYQGSEKPWSVTGLFNNSSIYYQNFYNFSNSSKYHIVFDPKDKLVKVLKKIPFFNLFKPINFLKFIFLIKSFLNKKQNNEI